MLETGHCWELGLFHQTLSQRLLTPFASCQARMVTEPGETLHPDPCCLQELKSHANAHTAIPEGIPSTLSCPPGLPSAWSLRAGPESKSQPETISSQGKVIFPSELSRFSLSPGSVSGGGERCRRRFLEPSAPSCNIPSRRQIPDSRSRGAADLPGPTLLSQECI